MKIELSQEEIGLMQYALLELPAKISFALLLKISDQLMSQVEETDTTEA